MKSGKRKGSDDRVIGMRADCFSSKDVLRRRDLLFGEVSRRVGDRRKLYIRDHPKSVLEFAYSSIHIQNSYFRIARSRKEA